MRISDWSSDVCSSDLGSVLSLADLTAAAHLSVADYLGGIDWRGHKQTTDWYAVMKSRPSFRPFLGERMEVIAPPAHYAKVDRSEERRVGKECVSKCRSRLLQAH